MFSSRDPLYPWLLIGMFTINYSMVVIAIETIGLLLPQLSEELSLSLSQQGLLASSVLFSNLILEIPANWLFSRYRPWRCSAVAFFAAALFVAFNGWAPTFAVLIIARIGLGIIYLSTQAPRTLLVLQWIPRRQLGLANGALFSVLETTIGIGFIVMPLILAAVDDWRNALYVWAGACGVGATVWLALGRDKTDRGLRETVRPALRSPLGVLFRYKEPWILGLGVAGASAGRVAFYTFWPTYLGEEYGIAVTVSGLILGIAGMARGPMILVVTLSSFIAARTPLLLVACGVLECATFMGMIFGETRPLLFLSGTVNGMLNCFIPAMMTRIYGLPGIQEREAAVAVAVYFSCLWMGAALGPLAIGLLSEATDDLGLALLFAALAPLTLVAAGLILQGSGKGSESKAKASTTRNTAA